MTDSPFWETGGLAKRKGLTIFSASRMINVKMEESASFIRSGDPAGGTFVLRPGVFPAAPALCMMIDAYSAGLYEKGGCVFYVPGPVFQCA